MRVLISLVLIAIIGSFQSCSNDDGLSDGRLIEREVHINNRQIFEYDLGSFGVEDGAEIRVQAEHFQISQLEGSGNIIYKYKAAPTYEGTDFVEIATMRGSDGASPPTVVDIIRITFMISN